MEGIPPYLIATNKHLAKMIRLKAATRSALSGIEGIGEGKAAKYGEPRRLGFVPCHDCGLQRCD